MPEELIPKGYASNLRTATSPQDTDFLGIQQGTELLDMKKISYEDLKKPIVGENWDGTTLKEVDDHANTLQDQVDALSVGGPKGVYDTLVDLQTADPDHTFTYVVKADGNWYFWNTISSDWTSGGVYNDSTAFNDLAGTGRTTETVKQNADRLDTLEGTGEGSVAKAIDDAVSPLEEDITDHEERIAQNESDIGTLEGVVDNNRLYSDSQYLALKAKYEAQQIALNASKAELYTDDPILQYGAVEIIGDGYEADGTPIDVSANVVDGKLEMEQKGLTITNLVTNGDFSQGTTGWTGGSGTLSASNNILSFTGDGSIAVPQLRQTVPSLVYSAGDKIFVKAKLRVTNADCAYVRVQFEGGTTVLVKLQNTPTQNQWYDMSAIITTVVGMSSPRLWFAHAYSDATTAIGKVMEVDGNYGVSAYNLTALGLDHITDTDILAKLLPYVDGTANVGKMGVRVVGKNLFDNNMYSFGNFYTEPDGRLEVNASYRAYRVKVGANAQITFKRNDGGNLSSNGGIIRFENKSNQLLSTNTGGYGASSVTFTTPATCQYMVFSIAKSIDIPSRLYQLEYSATATPYEPYQEQLTFLPAIGNSLPNGVADSVKTTVDGWVHTKNVSVDYTLLSADMLTIGAYDGWQYVTLKRFDNQISMPGSSIISGQAVVLGYSEFPYADRQTIVLTTTRFTVINGNIVLGFPLGTYADLATARTALAGNVILRYQLAIPITTHYPLPLPTSGKTIHRFAGEEKIALYGTGVTFSENVLTVLSAVKFVAGVMTDITSLATITGDTVTFSGVNATDVVYVKVEHSVNRPLGILEHTPAVSNTASRLAAIEAWIAAQGA